MKISKTDEAKFALDGSLDELRTLNNALNEAINGFDIDDRDVPTRLGATREEVLALFDEIHGAVRR